MPAPSTLYLIQALGQDFGTVVQTDLFSFYSLLLPGLELLHMYNSSLPCLIRGLWDKPTTLPICPVRLFTLLYTK